MIAIGNVGWKDIEFARAGVDERRPGGQRHINLPGNVLVLVHHKFPAPASVLSYLTLDILGLSEKTHNLVIMRAGPSERCPKGS
jgi:hypothetical protein